MKMLLRSSVAFAILLGLGGCSPKKTTVVSGSDEQPALDPGAAATVTSNSTAAGANAKRDDDLAALYPVEKAKFDAWLKKHNLAGDDATLDQDTDGDGYSNREEFLADTNPRDASSMPGVIENASVKAINEVKLPFILREVKGTKARIQRTDSGAEEELTTGSQPKGLPYKVTEMKYQVKADKHGVNTDVSHMTLENTQTHESVVVIRDLPARTNETHAVIVGPNGQEKKVHIDETVEIPGMPGRQFKVLELRADQVLVEELSTKKALAIPKR